AVRPDEVVYDATLIVVSALMFLYSLLVMVVFVYVLLRVWKRQGGSSPAEQKRALWNSIIFATFSTILCALFMSRFVLACLFSFRSMQFELAYVILALVSDGVFLLSVIIYLGAALWAAR